MADEKVQIWEWRHGGVPGGCDLAAPLGNPWSRNVRLGIRQKWIGALAGESLT